MIHDAMYELACGFETLESLVERYPEKRKALEWMALELKRDAERERIEALRPLLQKKSRAVLPRPKR